MSPTTTAVRTRNLTVYLSVKNAEDRVFGGRTYAPSNATVHYSTSFAPRGEIRGPARKKDGTLGLVWVNERWNYEDAPGWLKSVVDAERPEWARPGGAT